jgi:hypothetical protein
MALFISTLVVVWFHQTGHQLLRFPFRPWYTKKEEPSFADMLTTLRRVTDRCAMKVTTASHLVLDFQQNLCKEGNLLCAAVSSYEEKSPQPHPKQSGLKTWIAQLTELLSRTG